MKFSFTATIDNKFIVDTELSTMFGDLETFINTPSIENDNIDIGTISNRNLKHTMSFDLSSEGLEPNISFYGPFATNWYVITETVLDWSTALTESNDGRPSFIVNGYLYIADCDDTCDIARVTIGYSTDSGLTYVPILNVSRPTGRTCGDRYTFYDGAQTHYWDNSPAYYPPNQPTDSPIVVTTAFGGDYSPVPITSIDRVAIMVQNTVPGEAYIRAFIELISGDNQK